jgi:SurA N-terminal domain
VIKPVLATLAAAVSLLALTACNPMEPGAAAIVGTTRISEQQLAQEVEAILQAQGQPTDRADASLTSTTLGRMVIIELVRQAAAKAGVAITQGDIDTTFDAYLKETGGQQQVEQVFVQQNIAPSQIEDIIVLNLQAQALGRILLPNGDAQAQGQELARQLGTFSVEQGTTISPRYGAWEPDTLKIGPLTDPLAVAPSAG